ncbi:MAG: hypothetical protein ACI379_12700 [Nocardioides sp.]|uniref:hypothetical protein n=1 Tax=Nocardioides sp. TaxID=35761 RepID=UPI003F0B2598
MATSRPPAARALLLLPGGAALLAGLDAALLLLGLPAPVTIDRLPDVHGVLMVLGFVGTVISLERAVALGHRAGYLAPATNGLAVLALLSPAPVRVGGWLLVAGTAGLLVLYVPLWRRQRDEAVLVQALGALLATGAALLWATGTPTHGVIGWLVGFVVLTIAGERLELARLAMGPSAGTALVTLSCILAAGVLAQLLWPAPGTVLLGAALAALTVWLVRHDVARRTVHSSGLTRYMAVCMLAGYAWLAVAATLWFVGGHTAEGAAYDAVIHAVFLGFTISMVMAHAPVILPAVLRRSLPYHPALYAPVALLHGSLALRVLVGDAYGVDLAWQVGGALNVAAVLSFVAVAVWSATRPARGRTAPPSPDPSTRPVDAGSQSR